MPTYWGTDTPPILQEPGGKFWWSNNLASEAVLLQKLITSMAGGQTQAATVAVAMQKMLTSFSGVMHPKGVISVVQQMLVAAMSGGQTQYATSAVQMQQLSAAINALQIQQGAVGAQLLQMTSLMFGGQTQFATMQPVFPAMKANIAGQQTQIGSMATALPLPLKAAMSGQNMYQGPLAAALPSPMSSAMLGGQTHAGSIGATIGALSASIQGVELPKGVMGSNMSQLVATINAAQTQSGAMAVVLGAMTAAIQGANIQRGPVAVALKNIAVALTGGQLQAGQMAASLLQASTIIAGQIISATPVAFRTSGGAGTENLNTITCSVTPSAGDSVVVFILNGGSGDINPPTYGASNLRMKCRGQIRCGATTSGSGIIFAAYSIDAVAAGAATISITCTNNNWCQAAAVAYSNVAGYALTKTSMGQSSTALTSGALAIPGAGSMLVNSFCHNQTISSPTGGTNRLLETAGFVKQTISDSNANVTFAATASSTGTWGGLMVPLLSSVPSSPNINHCLGQIGPLNGSSTQTLSIMCNVGDYVFVDFVENGNTAPASVTCAGVAMTQIYTANVPGLTGGTGLIRRYVSATAITSGQISLGAVSVQLNQTSSNWWGWCAVSVSGITTIGTSAGSVFSSNSQPSQAISLSAGQYALHTFSTYTQPGYITNATNYYDGQGGQFAVPSMNFLDTSATVTMSLTSVQWGSMYTILS